MKRFFDKIEKTNTCWLWKNAIRGKGGYGCIKINGKVIDAHRVSYTLHKGDIPEGMFVCHTCDNPKCVNPDHLFLGTQSDNMKDCSNKGRLMIPDNSKFFFKKGHNPKNSFLKNPEEIINLKKVIFNRDISLKELSKKLDIPYQLIRDISCGRIYKKY